MRIAGAFILLLGLGLAMGHPLYALHYSGHRVTRIALQEGASWSVSGLAITRAGAMRAVQVPLDPSMSPVRFIVTANVGGPPGAVSRFDAVVAGSEGEIAWRGQVAFTTGTGTEQESSIVVHTIDVERGGAWGFALLPTGQRAANVSGVALEVRRNVGGISTAAIGIGATLALWGALMVMRRPPRARGDRPAGWRDTTLPDRV